MIRFSWLFALLVSSVSFAQPGAVSIGTVSIDSDSTVLLQSEFVPIKMNGELIWYDIANDVQSDSLRITNFIQPESGFHYEFVLRNDSLWGIMNGSGFESVPFIYDSIIYIDNQLITLSDDVWTYHYQRWYFDDFREEEVVDSLIEFSFDSLYRNETGIYLFHQGKTGIILPNGSLIHPKYDGIAEFQCHSSMTPVKYYLSLLGNEYNLLDGKGEELLPQGVKDLRCTEDGVFEFKRGEHPEFYIPYMKKFVRPNGRDIIFYGSRGYKLYNQEKTKSELHLMDESVLSGTFDDYFFLNADYYAVRRNGKVGLTKNGVDLIGSIKYDQINTAPSSIPLLGSSQKYFRFYVGDACGLMDVNGVEVLEARYANILTTAHSDRFIVLDNGLTGVVDRSGRIIVPIEYDHIYLNQRLSLFVVQLNQRIGMLKFDGKPMIPVEYEKFNVLEYFGSETSTDALMVFGKNGSNYFAKRSGFIQEQGFDHYDHTKGILKTYDKRSITVFIFDNEGNLEEKQEYPLFENTIIEKNYFRKWTSLTGWDISELEENQRDGYFGLRNYRKRGFGVKPVYRTVHATMFGDYIGAIGTSNLSYDWIENIEVKVVRGFDHLKVGTGTINTPSFFSSDVFRNLGGSGDRYVNTALNSKQNLSYSELLNVPTINFSRPVRYSESLEESKNYIKYYFGGEVELCPIENAEISFFDYYTYLNSLSACSVSNDLMKNILNPKIGVRFSDATIGILNSSYLGVGEDYVSFRSPNYFEEFDFVNYAIYFERSAENALGRLKSSILPKKNREEVLVNDVFGAKEVTGFLSDYILADVKSGKMAKIHTDYPDFYFWQDSINVSYNAGRIIRRVDSNTVQLLTPNGEIKTDNCILIRYLKQERFAILKSSGWELIDKNGKLLNDRRFSNVSDFENNRAEFELKDGSAIVIGADGEELKPLPEPRIFLDRDYFYYASNPNQLYNRVSNEMDMIQEGESYEAIGLFVSKKDENQFIRRFASEETIKLKSASKLKLFGSCLYYKKGKHLYSLDSDLVSRKFKKMDKFRAVSPEIGWLEGKRDQLIDSDWNTICELKEDESFEIRNGELFVFEDDSVYRNYGTFKPVPNDSVGGGNTPEVRVVSEKGKYGVKKGKKFVLPMTYSWLSKVNDNEYLTKLDSEKQLFTPRLNRIGERPFDWFIQTTGGNFVFFYKDSFYIVSKEDLEKSKP